MGWQFDGEGPIYLQIADRIGRDIVSGRLKPGTRLPSAREYSLEAGVNHNTMQRALTELDETGLLCSERTALGRFVTDDPAIIDAVRETLYEKLKAAFLKNMFELGYVRVRIEKGMDHGSF